MILHKRLKHSEALTDQCFIIVTAESVVLKNPVGTFFYFDFYLLNLCKGIILELYKIEMFSKIYL